MKLMKRFIATVTLLCSMSICTFASENAISAFVEGCRAYSQSEWASAKFILRKAVSYKENVNPDTYYMLISSEINDNDYKQALEHCDTYLSKFPNSVYYNRISYLKGKTLYNSGEYEQAIIVLSDFCHQTEDMDLYASALFYIGESLYASYTYDEALSIFQQVVQDFPECDKVPAAKFRIETILQLGREEKLLYLLKQTGEEYLNAKEEYEKQLRSYNVDSMNNARQKLNESQVRNEELERQVAELERQLELTRSEMARIENERTQALQKAESIERQNNNLDMIKQNPPIVEEKPAEKPYDENKDKLRMLKLKALEAQRRLEDKAE